MLVTIPVSVYNHVGISGSKYIIPTRIVFEIHYPTRIVQYSKYILAANYQIFKQLHQEKCKYLYRLHRPM
jgi:hypothetical protein